MASKSKARKTIEELLSAATDPTTKAELANRLSLLTERESRTRARRRREKAKRPPKPPAPPRDDSADEFRLCECPVGEPCTCPPKAPPTPQSAPAAPPIAAPKPPPVPEIEPEEPPDPRTQNGYATTRQIAALNYPGARYFDPVDRIYREDYEPRSSVGPVAGNWIFAPTLAVKVDTYSGGKFESEREAEQREAERPLTWDEQCRAAAEAASARRWS